MNRPAFKPGEITVSQIELSHHVQQSLDETHRDLAWIRTGLITSLYLILTVVNYLTLEGQTRIDAMVFSLLVVISFALISCFHRFVEYPSNRTNLVTFGELCVLQADSIAFALVTDDIMSGFGVYVLMISSGIFMTTAKSITASNVMLLATWVAAVYFRGAEIDPAREGLMLASALFGAYFFFAMRVRSARKLSLHQLKELKYKESLEQAFDHIETLSGLLPICASCKNIRMEGNEWTPLDVYVRDRSDVEFTHSLCPTCHSDLYPELQDK